MIAIGLMSGTSLDGVDAILVEIKNEKFKQLKFVTLPYEESFKKRILKNLNYEELDKFLDFYTFIYSKIKNNEVNLKLIDILKSKYNQDEIYDRLFHNNNKDLIYYYYLGTKINKLLEEENE